jgi:2-C-methyl-D-erythritol 4-phosphate cytidylyltransferase
VRKVVLVVAPGQVDRYRDALGSAHDLDTMVVSFQAGGLRRQDSVYNGLLGLDPDCEIVVIHDGARPLVSPAMIDRCAALAEIHGAVVAAVPVQDTIKIASADRRVRETPPRDSLWQAQTPQAFKTEIIREAYRIARMQGIEGTDDSMLVERLGMDVLIVEGERSNLKVTVPQDLMVAELLLREKGFA